MTTANVVLLMVLVCAVCMEGSCRMRDRRCVLLMGLDANIMCITVVSILHVHVRYSVQQQITQQTLRHVVWPGHIRKLRRYNACLAGRTRCCTRHV